MSSPGFAFASGVFTSASSAVAVDISLGYIPKYVKTVTIDDISNGYQCEWWEGMPDASGIRIKLADGIFTLLTSGGITPLDSSSATGFTVGTSCQVNSKYTRWIAIG